MPARPLQQLSAILLAFVATAATLGTVDTLATGPARLAATRAAQQTALAEQAAVAPVDFQRVVIIAPRMQRVVVIGHRSQA